MRTPNFLQMPSGRPVLSELKASSSAIEQRWMDSTSTSDRLSILSDWNKERIEFDTDKSLAVVRYQIETTSSDSRKAQAYFDGLTPDVEIQYLNFLKLVISSDDRENLESTLGPHVFKLWERFVESCDPSVVKAKKLIAQLTTEYSAVSAGVVVHFRGEKYNLSAIKAKFSSEDRTVRREALIAVDDAMGGVAGQLDSIYDQLVSLRQEIADKLGYKTYTPVGYGAMLRTDYGPEEVADFRKQIREIVVPLASKVRARQAKRLGLADDYCLHDEWVQDPRGVPLPKGDHDWMLKQAKSMFDDLGPDFSEFFETMQEFSLLDLKSREGKAGGGFCISFERWDVPFIFANFNGTQDDVLVFTHECGHAFQTWYCRPQPVLEYTWPTYEACEIHSMSFEFQLK
jgi:M3 family oligoendopeptidase